MDYIVHIFPVAPEQYSNLLIAINKSASVSNEMINSSRIVEQFMAISIMITMYLLSDHYPSKLCHISTVVYKYISL